MYQIFFFFVTTFHSYYYVSAQPPAPPLSNGDLVANFEPSLAIVTGVLAIMFALTFVVLVYAKCCHMDLLSGSGDGRRQDRLTRQGFFFNRSTNSSARFSGLDKTAIESLPMFRFSALKGSKQGLECSVCLSKFESVEILRLLPKCRHAFHIGCIDQWLEQHATCPLCRDRVSIEEDTSVYVNSFRFLNESARREDSSLEIYIEREEEEERRRRQREEVGSSSRFSIGGSFRKILKLGHKEKPLLEQQGNDKDENKVMHKFNHRIFVSDVVFKNRWSNVSSSDLMFLNSEMVCSISSERFSFKRSDEEDQRGNLRIKEDMENKLSSMKTMLLSESKDSGSKLRSVMTETGRRSVSEITTVPRLSIAVHGDCSGSNAATASETEERRRRLWLPIASKTAQFFENPILNKLDTHLSGLLALVSPEEYFAGKPGQSTVLRVPGLGVKLIGLIGLGQSASSAAAFQGLGEAVATVVKASQSSSVVVALSSHDNESKLSSASALASGVVLGLFEDGRYKSESKKPSLSFVDIIGFGTGPELEKKLKYAEDLCLLTKQQKWLLHNSDVFTANILNEEQCRELKMGSYLAVPAASADPPFFIHLVIDLRLMKFDMGDSAAVLGAAKAIGEIKRPGVEVHFIVAAFENMISGTGMRDLVMSSQPQTERPLRSTTQMLKVV
ncbi:hypothetical protein HID58_029982 [Brassica napus]|uniref:RING-type E3 ubiquitin transferase n=1 Tax=Brassica napus TaxID=3708 RepID=A0ABQ8CEM8_BRANA|nr:hypothetical protein HID58_029982 [Brassica napus]